MAVTLPAPLASRTPEPATLGPGTRALGWLVTLGLLYILMCAVGLISSGFRGLSGGAAHTLFDFASDPLVGLCVGVLSTVLIQSSSTTTAIAVAAVGTGALPIEGAVPIILGANVGTTVTCTLVALGFVGDKEHFRNALGASTIHDMYNLLSLLIFFPIEVAWHPLQRASKALTDAVYGSAVLPDPARFNIVRTATHPVVNALASAALHFTETFGPLIIILLGALLIFLSVRYVGKLLKVLMVGRARRVLTAVMGRNDYVAMGAGTLVTVLTQSSTVTQSVLVPFAGTGILTPRQIYPVTLGANLGTTFTALIAAFAVEGGAFTKIGLQAAFVHLLYNVFAIIVIFVIPILRPVPLWCAQRLAAIAVDHRWLIAAYIVTVFIALPAVVILVAALM
ncbi:MAG: Na/Pi symporter [Acidimicrobiaceae bacterium]|nr:Na/Pi symporter [Acidimicrobiaceae bacterium]